MLIRIFSTHETGIGFAIDSLIIYLVAKPSQMRSGFTRPVNIAAILIPLFFFIIFLINPDFGNPLFLVAIGGMLITLIMIFVAVIFIYRRCLLKKHNKYYLPVGLINLSFGITCLISTIMDGTFTNRLVLFVSASIVAGIFIVADNLWLKKMTNDTTD